MLYEVITDAIDVRKTAILPEMEKKGPLEKKLLDAPVPEALLRTRLETDEAACLGCGNCVIVCPVNARITSYNVCYTKLLRAQSLHTRTQDQSLRCCCRDRARGNMPRAAARAVLHRGCCKRSYNFV